MALPDKSQIAQPVAASFATLPSRYPELPEDVVKRFPSLGEWQSQQKRLYARITEAFASVSEDLALPINLLKSETNTLSAASGDLQARILAEQTARIDGDTALAATIASIVATAGTTNSVFVQSTTPTANNVNDVWYNTAENLKPYYWSGTAWTDLTDARLTGAVAAIANESIVRANADSALTTNLNSLVATVNNNYATVMSTFSAYATKTYAEALRAEAISIAAGDATAKVDTEASARASADGAIHARWGVAIDVNGRITGRINLNGTNESSSFLVAADRFVIQNGVGTVTLADIRTDGLVFGADLRSDNFASGSAGWRLTRSGDLEVNNGVFRGTVSAAYIDHACVFIKDPLSTEGGQIRFQAATGYSGFWNMDVSSGNKLRVFGDESWAPGASTFTFETHVEIVGTLQFGTFYGSGGSIAGYILVKDLAGNTRKLAVLA